ncbi:hypothetical protein BWK62_12760 [Flavobacterium oreochromis]|uniref:AMP-dependent synthetase/ligase domain-containing protein n=1 Tax=Flavobacterium columnare TaxID=996 RepID=A0A246G8A9_9FLAO|nr:hypothetical protein BWK62_12760 [Flavobacterium oreochromis]
MQKAQINNLIDEIESNKEGKIISFYKDKRIEISFEELYPKIRHVVSFLCQKGYNATTTIGILGRNNLEWVIMDFACIYCGIKLVPLEPNTDVNYLQEYGFNLNCILVDKYYMDKLDKLNLSNLECICMNDLIDSKITPIEIKQKRHQYASEEVISYKMTSGSTGKPKIIGHSVEGIENTINGVQNLFKHNHRERLLIFLPLNLLQQRYWLYSAVFFKFTIIIVPKEYLFVSLKTEKPTVLMGVPYIYELLYRDFTSILKKNIEIKRAYRQFIESDTATRGIFLPFMDYLGGHINYLWTGSSPIPKEVLQFYFSMNIPLYQGYGMNETCIIAKNYPDNNKIGSVGKIFPNIELRFDENDQILIKNKYPICRSYFVAPVEDQNNTFLKDGYIATGDQGYMDEEGYLFITNRVKEMIALSSSKKIMPRSIEEKIGADPQVKFCIVYGDNRPYLTALIIPHSEDVTYSEIEPLVKRYNTTCHPEEYIYKFFVTHDDFTEENDLISNQNKIKRKNIYEKYKTQFEELYDV